MGMERWPPAIMAESAATAFGSGPSEPGAPPTSGQVKASAASYAAKPRSDIGIGQRVFHTKFGYGVVEAVEGNKLAIDFEHSGTKHVLDSFVTPA